MATHPPLDPHFRFPPAGVITCGLRTWLPKRLRRHDWRDAGQDIRHQFDGTFALATVKICIACGKDEDTRVKGAA